MSNITLPRDMALHIRDVLLVWSRFSLPADKAAFTALDAALAEPDAIARAVEAEREAILAVIEAYKVPVGNSAAGEMACEWTMDALRDLRDAIRARGTK